MSHPSWVPSNLTYVENWVTKSYAGSHVMTRWVDPTGNFHSFPAAGPRRDRRS